MLAFGAHDKEFYHLGQGREGHIVYLVEMIRTRDKSSVSNESWTSGGRESWVPQIRSRLVGAIEYLGCVEVRLRKPLTLVDFSSFPESSEKRVRFIEIADGLQEFDLLTVQFPYKLGSKVGEFAVIPGTTYGLSFIGLLQTQVDHEPYWRNYEQRRILSILKQELARRLIVVQNAATANILVTV